MPTKWYNENHKNTIEDIMYADTPISIAAARQESNDRPKVYCPECQFDTIIKDGSGYRCTRESCRHTFDIKHEDKKLQTGIIVENDNMDDNAETLVSTKTPDPDQAFYNKDNIEPQGAFKALQDRGIRITSYSETDGAGRPLKRNRWS